MGAPVGNDNAAKSRLVEQGLKRAAMREDWKRFHAGLEKIWDAFAEGERWAVEFVRDTMDGKPKQQIEAVDEQGRTVAVALIAYDPSQLQPAALPAPNTPEAGLRH